MFSRFANPQFYKACEILVRNVSTSNSLNSNVTVLGASGGIGQPISLLLKTNPLVTKLSLYDIVHTLGVAADLSHIDTKATVVGHVGADQLENSLLDSDIVVIPAGVPRKPGMSRDDLFNTNASIVANLTAACAKVCPKAVICIIANPVNSTVPIACEVYKKADVDPCRIYGVTTLDMVRANTFFAQLINVEPSLVNVPVIGGHAGITIIPLVSQAMPQTTLNERPMMEFVEKVQDAGTEVVKAKAGAGSATLSMAFAGARFANSWIQALNGDVGIQEYAYVRNNVTDSKYFAIPIILQSNGKGNHASFGTLNHLENLALVKAIPELKASIKKGEDFVANM